MADAVRRQYNKLKIQTKAEIRQTIDQLLVGEFIVRHFSVHYSFFGNRLIILLDERIFLFYYRKIVRDGQ